MRRRLVKIVITDVISWLLQQVQIALLTLDCVKYARVYLDGGKMWEDCKQHGFLKIDIKGLFTRQIYIVWMVTDHLMERMGSVPSLTVKQSVSIGTMLALMVMVTDTGTETSGTETLRVNWP